MYEVGIFRALALLFLTCSILISCFGSGEFLLIVGVFEISVSVGALVAGSWDSQPIAALLASGVLFLNIAFAKLRRAKARKSVLRQDNTNDLDDYEADPLDKAKAILARENRGIPDRSRKRTIELTPLNVTEDLEGTEEELSDS